jgi:alkylation response protein AidB-like acyl-CoA dehydrogenase
VTDKSLLTELRSVLSQEMPLPGGGNTSDRLLRHMEIGKRNLSLARLAEAHYDAVAILSEANRIPAAGMVYGVWASEVPGKGLKLSKAAHGYYVDGSKMFSSGAPLIDRALVTVNQPEHRLVEIDLRAQSNRIAMDDLGWKAQAFRETRTSTVVFEHTEIAERDVIGNVGWYLERPGFWHGACGPAACWAGGAEGLVEFASLQIRRDPHTKAHFAAMQAAIWGLRCLLSSAGAEIDRTPCDKTRARIRALKVRHLIEQACSDILRRFGRAYGPYPLAMDEEIAQRYQELDLYLRQSHAERDLESLGQLLLGD